MYRNTRANRLRLYGTSRQPPSDSKPTMTPRSHSGPAGTVAAADGGGGAAASAVTLPVGPVSGVKTRSGASHPVAP